MIIELALGGAAAVAAYIAYKKHGSVAAVEASAKKEISIVKADIVAEAEKLEILGGKVEADVKTEITAIVTKLKSL